MGIAKSIQLKAAINLGIRASKDLFEAQTRLENPIQAYRLIKDEMKNEKRELFIAIFLDVRAQVICHEIIAIGTLSQTTVHPREFFYPAIRHKAASVIIAHNHPSGDPTPSIEDIELTKKLIEAGKMMHILIRDHLIIGKNQFVSLRKHEKIIF